MSLVTSDITNPAVIDTSSLITGFTEGSVLFIDSVPSLAEDNANLFWDDASNRLGIGTTGPTEPFHVFGTESDGVQAIIQRNSTTAGHQSLLAFAISSGAGNGVYSALGSERAGDMVFKTTSDGNQANLTEAMRIDGSQNVGIGVDPTSRLHLRGPSGGDPIITGDYVGAGSNSTINLYDQGTGDMILTTNFSTADILFQTNGANTRMTINQAGDVGIGVAPTSKLHVDGETHLGGTTNTNNHGINVAPSTMSGLKGVYETSATGTNHGIEFDAEHTLDLAIAQNGTISNNFSCVYSGDVLNHIANATAIGLQNEANFSGTINASTSNVIVTGTQNTAQFTGTNTDNSSISIRGAAYTVSGNIGTAGSTRHDGLILTVTGTADVNYGLNILSVTGATTNYGIFDNSGANWALDNDNHKIIWGEGQDGSIYYDGTDLVANPHEVGDGHFKIDGTYATAIETVTASSDTLNQTNSTVLCDCTSNAITINLPAASAAGRLYIIKKIDSSVNTVTIDGSGGETIDGATTATLNAQYESLTLQSNGSNWFIL